MTMSDASKRFRKKDGRPWPVLRLLPGEAEANARNAERDRLAPEIEWEELVNGKWWTDEFFLTRDER